MWDKLKTDKYAKSLLTKLITILIVASIALLLFDVLTQSKDGRRQIVDDNGGTEYLESAADASTKEENKLKDILSDIKGVGEVDVMITYKENEPSSNLFNGDSKEKQSKVGGVIVTASGAGDIIIRNNITNAVTAVFNIPASNVSVFEKNTAN